MRIGQVVDHAHVHLIPRFSGDTFVFTWPAGKYAEGEMPEMQKKILEKLK
jgi:diadenosine tetraphosphate (Ap4A) HIT family hydrolase